MKILYSGFHAFDPPTETAQQKGCTGYRRYYEPPNVKHARQFWGVIANLVRQRMAENGKDIPTCLHVAFCKPLLKKHKNAASPLWHTNKPDLDNWNKLLQDCLVDSEVLFDDCKVSRLVLEKFYSCVPGVRITLGLLDDDDLPELGDLITP